MHTIMSHDVSGNYFDLDMELLEPVYEYGFKFSFYDPSLSDWVEQVDVWLMKVMVLRSF